MRLWAVVLFVVTSAYAQEPRQATLAQQKMCADQAKKFASEPEFKTKDPLFYISHYDSRMNVCYVMIRLELDKGNAKEWSQNYQIYDAFEGTGRGNLQGKVIGPDNKPYSCYVRPMGRQETIYCKTDEEFWDLVRKYFGLERP